MNKLVIDSTVFVSTLGKPDDFSLNSKKFFTSIEKISVLTLIIPSLVVAETANVLQKQNISLSNLLAYFSGFEIVTLDEEFLRQFISSIKNSTLKTSDAIIAITAKIKHAQLITWDSKLLSETNTLCSTSTPTQYLYEHTH